MINPKETFNNLFHGKSQDEPQPKDIEETTENPYSVESENLAMPEVHTKDHEKKTRESEEEQNKLNQKEEMVFDTLAVPEIHIKN